MDPQQQPSKEIRIRIEAPQTKSEPPKVVTHLPRESPPDPLPRFYFGLLFLVFVFSGLSLYLSFFAT